jgi:transcriptional regulator with XRE-family HTH domain
MDYSVEKAGYDSKRFALRLELRAKNSALVSARERLGLTQKEAAEKIGIAEGTLSAYERMRAYPQPKTQKMVCDFYRNREEFMFEDDVFPEELRSVTQHSAKYVFEGQIPRNRIIRLQDVNEKELAAAAPGYLGLDDRSERNEKIMRLVNRIVTEREAEVFRLYFLEEMTLDEIGDLFRCVGENIRHIREMATRRIRHSPLRNELREILTRDE